jgi:hypothetical protein
MRMDFESLQIIGALPHPQGAPRYPYYPETLFPYARSDPTRPVSARDKQVLSAAGSRRRLPGKPPDDFAAPGCHVDEPLMAGPTLIGRRIP